MAGDILSADAITARLAATSAAASLLRDVVYFAQVGSTNNVCRQLAAEGAPEGTLVIADEQTAGRGRMGRRWYAPPGAALLLSLLFCPDLEPAQAARLTMLCSLAAAEAIQALAGLPVGIKWPNDLVLGDAKLAGLLAELGTQGSRLEYVVVGLGINVNLDAVACADIDPHATSLQLALGHPIDRLDLLVVLLERIAERYSALRAGASILEDWRARLVTLGRRVTVTEPGRTCSGIAETTDADGALCVRQDDGVLAIVRAGDVTLRPPRAGGPE